MTTRTDVHRPSAPEFDPEAYDCRGVFDTCTDPLRGGGSQRDRLDAVNALIEAGYRHGPGSAHQCGHCGANIRYCALLVREDVREFIYVGETCLDGRFELTKGEFDRLRKASGLDRERNRLINAFNELCDQHPALAYATYLRNVYTAVEAEYGDAARYSGLEWGCGVGPDIARKARQYGSASDKQLALIERIVAEQDAKLIAFEAKQAELAGAPDVEPLSAGRQVIEGVVVARKEESAYFGYTERTVFKMLVKLDGGQRVWGTEPSSISPDKGTRVRFTATVTPKEGEPDFGFYSRPTKAEIVEDK
jgi:hypothetical protein